MQSFQEQPLPEHPAPRPGQPCSRVFPGPARLQIHPAKVGTSLSGRQAGMDTNPTVAFFYGGCKKGGGPGRGSVVLDGVFESLLKF